MSNYDFKSLSAYDFEILVRDLLQKKLGLTLESFKSGRDGGIDLRYKDSDKLVIVQCKHYASSSVSQLKTSLKNEVPKVKELQPTRYIVATSLGLNPQNKDEIKELFSPYCQSTHDIYGNQDLNNLLNDFPEVERHNYKLWLTSSEMLNNIMHSEIYNQSKVEIDRIIRKTKLYVQTNSYFKARDILKESKYCIITGIPGIGKTSLAEILLLDYISNGFEVFKIYDITEVHKIFNPDKKQVFYYDDFLGQTSFGGGLKKNEDEKLSTFIDEINKYKTTYFILTTRDYILNQAKLKYEVLNRTDFDSGKCVVRLQDISTYHRANILYNHIYFSNIDQIYKKSILQNKNYLKIIEHPNYNPRIVEWMTKDNLDLDGQYIDFFMDFLNNPIALWEHIFENQLSDSSKNLLLVLSTLPDSVYYDDLKKAFDSYHKLKSSILGFTMNMNDFKKSLKELDGNFLTIKKGNKGLVLEYNNASIEDFIDNYIVNNSDEFDFLCKSSVFFEQCIKIWDLVSNRSFSKGYAKFKYSQELIDALGRNFKSKIMPEFIKSHLVAIQMPSDNDGSNYESRLNFMIDIAPEINNKQYNEILCDLIHITVNSLDERQIDKNELIILSDKMNTSKYVYRTSKEEFCSKIKSCVLNDYYHLEGFETINKFIKIYPNQLTPDEHSKLQDEFVNYCECDCHQDILDETSIESGLSLLEDISVNLKVDISKEIEIIKNDLYSDYEGYEPDDDAYDRWRDSQYEIEDENEEIDNMFSTLDC
jgi:hypothetical protein